MYFATELRRSVCSSLNEKSIDLFLIADLQFAPKGFTRRHEDAEENHGITRSLRVFAASCENSEPPCKSILLEPQHRFGDDVALDLVRAAEDRELAHVEIPARGAGCIIRPDIFVGAEAPLVGQAVIADRLERELGDPLRDLGAPDLEDRAFRTGHLALRLGGERAQFRELESREIDLEFGDFVRELLALD